MGRINRSPDLDSILDISFVHTTTEGLIVASSTISNSTIAFCGKGKIE